MLKSSKSKKGKVPKITEAEYVEYISSLREQSDGEALTQSGSTPQENMIKEK